MKYDEKDSPLPVETCETTWHGPDAELHYLGPAGPAVALVEIGEFCHFPSDRVYVCSDCLIKMTSPKTEAFCSCGHGAFVADYVTVVEADG